MADVNQGGAISVLEREPAIEPEVTPQRRRIRVAPTRGDRIYLWIIRLAGLVVLAIISAIGLFLAVRATQALKVAKFKFLTTQAWNPDINHFGIAGVLTGTVLIALVAIVVSTPIAIGTALFTTEIAPPRLRRVMVTLVDVMAAVPSVVFGLWGKFTLQGYLIPIARWISTWFGWIPIFRVDGVDPRNPFVSGATVYTASTFIVGVVVALMVIPIQCTVMRESFSQAPIGEREAAFALGGTRWGMIRSVVLPFGRGGIIGGTMLGLGRALGETIVVYLIISPVFNINSHILQPGGNSVSSLIALLNSEASSFGISALMAAGLSLFVLTLIVNFTASAIVARSRSGAQSD
jgi:phosphate transport system permease protein